ncbi:hypothetical protein HK101_010281 [Irineochytrium annulatum]|nr:hypothetical protein HK101_010281 [Irineochytrium annulatum]
MDSMAAGGAGNKLQHLMGSLNHRILLSEPDLSAVDPAPSAVAADGKLAAGGIGGAAGSGDASPPQRDRDFGSSMSLSASSLPPSPHMHGRKHQRKISVHDPRHPYHSEILNPSPSASPSGSASNLAANASSGSSLAVYTAIPRSSSPTPMGDSSFAQRVIESLSLGGSGRSTSTDSRLSYDANGPYAARSATTDSRLSLPSPTHSPTLAPSPVASPTSGRLLNPRRLLHLRLRSRSWASTHDPLDDDDLSVVADGGSGFLADAASIASSLEDAVNAMEERHAALLAAGHEEEEEEEEDLAGDGDVAPEVGGPHFFAPSAGGEGTVDPVEALVEERTPSLGRPPKEKGRRGSDAPKPPPIQAYRSSPTVAVVTPTPTERHHHHHHHNHNGNLSHHSHTNGASPKTPSDHNRSSAAPTPTAAKHQHVPSSTKSEGPPQGEYIGRYRVIRTVGAGSFSKVKLAVADEDTGEDLRVAIKMVSKKMLQGSERLRVGMEVEIECMRAIKHENVVGLIETIDTPDYMCLVMEYVAGGELFDYIADHKELLTVDEIRRLFRQLVEVVGFLHTQNICHRDLKIENVLLTSTLPHQIKLTDFGLAVRFSPTDALLTARCGSEEYAAPEVILAQPYDPRRTDVWALGVILFAMVTGELPFSLEPGQRPKVMYHRIARVDYRFPEGVEVPGELRDLVGRMLTGKPERRITIPEMLEHEFLR